MSLGSSKLNPYATAYVPLAKRPEDVPSADFDSDISKVFGCYGSSSQDYYGQDAGNEARVEMDLAYLQTHFTSISEQSLIDVYFLNECDVDDACDMLSQLESLPDSLDIGDVSEPQMLPEFANLKLKDVAVVIDNASQN